MYQISSNCLWKAHCKWLFVNIKILHSVLFWAWTNSNRFNRLKLIDCCVYFIFDARIHMNFVLWLIQAHFRYPVMNIYSYHEHLNEAKHIYWIVEMPPTLYRTLFEHCYFAHRPNGISNINTLFQSSTNESRNWLCKRIKWNFIRIKWSVLRKNDERIVNDSIEILWK